LFTIFKNTTKIPLPDFTAGDVEVSYTPLDISPLTAYPSMSTPSRQTPASLQLALWSQV